MLRMMRAMATSGPGRGWAVRARRVGASGTATGAAVPGWWRAAVCCSCGRVATTVSWPSANDAAHSSRRRIASGESDSVVQHTVTEAASNTAMIVASCSTRRDSRSGCWTSSTSYLPAPAAARAARRPGRMSRQPSVGAVSR